MKKRIHKRWIIVPIVTGLLALAITGGAIFAHGNGHGNTFDSNGIITRVAEILGVEQTELEDAFTQAVREGQDEAIQNKLESGVEQGRLSQEDASLILGWFQERPDAAVAMRMFIVKPRLN